MALDAPAERKGRPVQAPSPRLVAAAALAGALSVSLTLPTATRCPLAGLLIFLSTGVIVVALLAVSIGLLLHKLPAGAQENPHRREEREARALAA